MMNMHSRRATAAVMMRGCNNGRYARNSPHSDCIIEEKTVVLQKKDNEGFGFVLRGAKGKTLSVPMAGNVCAGFFSPLSVCCFVHAMKFIGNNSWCSQLLDNTALPLPFPLRTIVHIERLS